MRDGRDRAGELLAAALAYAADGLFVLAVHSTSVDGVCSCGRLDCGSPGKHPRSAHGFLDASRDAGQIRAWWTQWPEANIAVSCGASGRVVADVDDKDDRPGADTWHALKEELEADLEDTAMVETPSGGFHVHYLAGGHGIGSKNDLLGPGIDVKAEGGYVLLPPSTIGGIEYTWVEGHGIEKVAVIPETLAKHIEYVTDDRSGVRQSETISAGARIPAGRRNVTLTSLAGVMRRRNMTEVAINAALLEENLLRCDPPLSPDEVGDIAGSVAKYAPGPESSRRFVHNCSDSGNAERLIDAFGGDIHYCPAWGRWLLWDGQRWAPDVALRIEHLASLALRRIHNEAAAGDGKDKRKELGKWALASESAHRRRAAVECARSDPRIVVRAEELDSDLWLFNCRNGTIDLHTGRLREHRREDLISKIAPVEFDADAHLELWERVLGEATDGSPEMQAFLRRLAGYSLTGLTTEEKLPFIYGPEATIKSTFLEALKSTWGDYAQTADFETFLRRSGVGSPRSDLARLVGARLVISIETESGTRLADGFVKMITGGDRIVARRLYHDEFEFKPQFTLWWAANDSPKMSDRDGALWRRILEIPFIHQIPKEKRDSRVKAALTDPAVAGAAILAWAVKGCLEWQRDGLGVPPSVVRATQDLRDEMDPLRDFLAECCEFAPHLWTPAAALREDYEAFARENGDRHLVSGRAWGERLRDRGAERSNRNHAKAWLGVGLVDADGNREPPKPPSPESL